MRRSFVAAGLFFGAVLLAGCGGLRTVRVAHVSPRPDIPPARYEALKNVYLRLTTPAASDLEKAFRALIGALSKEKNTRVSFEVDTRRFGRRLAEAVAFHGGAVSAYRFCNEKLDRDPFVKLLAPSSVLSINILGVDFSEKKRSEKREIQDQEGKKKTIEVVVHDITARARVALEWITYPDLAPLFSEPVVELSGETSFEGEATGRQESVLAELQTQLFDNGAAALINRVAPVQVVYIPRRVFVSTGTANWKDQFNLAVAAEQRRDYVTARTLYQEAQQAGAESEDGKKISWKDISASLSAAFVAAPPPPPSVKNWFGKKTVVLPFSDESNFVEASDLVRGAVFHTLTGGGYTVVPLAKADEQLRRKGITDGGQLPAVTPEKVAGWLDADFLVYGNLEDFNEVNVGVYRKRVVKGSLSLWSSSRRASVWSQNENVSTKSLAASGNDIAANFFGGLFNSFVERLAKKPMGPEIEEFVRRTTRPLPFR